MRFIFLLLMSFLTVACSPSTPRSNKQADAFAKDLKSLQNYFQIPGLAAMVIQDDEIVYEDYLGYADQDSETPLTQEFYFPIASITKVFTGVLAMQLVEAGNLNLDRPVRQYFPEMDIDSNILVKHILSHTSQGVPGEQFYYSSRFGVMTGILEQESGKSFAELMQTQIIAPLQLKEIFLLRNEKQIQSLDIKMAQPYAMNDALEPGFIDYGYSASAGLVATLNDLRIFSQALDDHTLMSAESIKKMFSPFKTGLPYGYGIFSQTFDGQQLVWAYGQYDCYSSLLLKVPEKGLSLILLANNNLMSDPPRLINGQISSSLFALSFIQNFLYGPNGMGILETGKTSQNSASFEQEKLKAQAQAASFMSRWDDKAFIKSQSYLESLFEQYPAYESYADLNLLHTINFLKTVAFHKELEPVEQFDEKLEKIGQALIEKDPFNPYANINLASYYVAKSNTELARYHYEQIVKAPNFADNWYTKIASAWIKENLN